MENTFLELMREKTNNELIQIVTINRSKYNPTAIEAAESEIIIRNFDENLSIELKSNLKNIDDVKKPPRISCVSAMSEKKPQRLPACTKNSRRCG